MSSLVACTACLTTYWSAVDADVIRAVRCCAACGARALEVVATREDGAGATPRAHGPR